MADKEVKGGIIGGRDGTSTADYERSKIV